MRWLALGLIAVTACEPITPLPGELVADSLTDTDGVHAYVGPEHVFWVSNSGEYAGLFAIYCGDLATLPIVVYDPVAYSVAPVALAGDRLVVTTEDDLEFLACDGSTTEIAPVVENVTAVAADPAAPGDVAWATGTAVGTQTTSTAQLSWLRGGVQHDAPIAGVPTTVVSHLAYGAGGLYAATDQLDDAVLWFVDLDADTTAELDTASHVGTLFPDDPFIDDSRPGLPDYSGGELAADDAGAMWSIYEDNHVGWLDRGLVMGYATTATVLAGPMYDTASFRSDGATLYWREDSSDPTTHYPDGCGASVWTTPRTGGAPAYLRGDDIRIDAFAGGDVYGFYDEIDEQALRRVPTSQLVPASTDAVICNPNGTSGD